MQTEEIRIIPQFTGQTSDTAESELKLRSGYLVYTSEFGGNLVNEFTVRDFLDNSNYEQLAIDFFNYLQQNFTTPEFNELYYNNLKLSNVFNDYYDRTIIANLPATKTVANLQLTATAAITYTNTNFLNYNQRSNAQISVVVGYNTGDSYYISVPINTTVKVLENQNYDTYKKDSLGHIISNQVSEQFRYIKKIGNLINQSINFVKTVEKTSPQYLLQSFVDLNFNDSESQFWSNADTNTGEIQEATLNNLNIISNVATEVVKAGQGKG